MRAVLGGCKVAILSSAALLAGCCNLFLEIVVCPDIVFPGDWAWVEVKTSPGALCEIQVKLPTGELSEHEELVLKQAGVDRTVGWRWLIGPATALGQGQLTVMARSCSRTVSQTQTLEFRRDRRFTLQDRDKRAQVNLGREFVGALVGNPTTGYQGEIVSELNPVVLELLGQEYVPEREKLHWVRGDVFLPFPPGGPR